MEMPITVGNEQQKLGFFSRLTGLFTSPGKVFSWLREKPDFLWPVIFLLMSVGFSIPIGNFQTKIMMEKFPQYAETMAQASANNQMIMIFGAIGALFGIALMWSFTTLIYWLFAKLMGGETTRFPAALSMIGYTYVTSSLQSLFQGGVLLTTGVLPPLGLDAGMAASERIFSLNGILYSQVNPFTIGALVLTCIALEKGFKLTRGKAIIVATILWIATIAYQVGSLYLGLKFLK